MSRSSQKKKFVCEPDWVGGGKEGKKESKNGGGEGGKETGRGREGKEEGMGREQKENEKGRERKLAD